MDSAYVVRSLLACPACKGRLEFTARLIRCPACDLEFPQSREDCIDLLPRHLWKPTVGRWAERQGETESAYRNLIADPVHAIQAYRTDYGPFAPFFATYGGRVLDIGGGNGIVRDYLPRDIRYVVVDPSVEWLGPEWSSIAGEFPCLKEKLCFVRGVGEHLPFFEATFDSLLSIWSLNHASRPDRVIREAYRVLSPGGRFLLILDDVPPAWRDVASGALAVRGVRNVAGTIARKLWAVVAGWPLQSDHIRIRESDLRAWISPGFQVIQRVFVGTYLTFELRRT